MPGQQPVQWGHRGLIDLPSSILFKAPLGRSGESRPALGLLELQIARVLEAQDYANYSQPIQKGSSPVTKCSTRHGCPPLPRP